jgi:hypothetical protein
MQGGCERGGGGGGNKPTARGGSCRLSRRQGSRCPLHLDLNVSRLHAAPPLLHVNTQHRPTLHSAHYSRRRQPRARPNHRRRLRTRSRATSTGHLRSPAGASPQPALALALARQRTHSHTHTHAHPRHTATMAGTRNYDFLVSSPTGAGSRPHSLSTRPAVPLVLPTWRPHTDRLGADQAVADWRLRRRKVMLSAALQ